MNEVNRCGHSIRCTCGCMNKKFYVDGLFNGNLDYFNIVTSIFYNEGTYDGIKVGEENERRNNKKSFKETQLRLLRKQNDLLGSIKVSLALMNRKLSK